MLKFLMADDPMHREHPTLRRAGFLVRAVSKFIDIILIFAAAEALPKVGWYAGLGYMLIGDGLFEGRSAGKRLTGLRVIAENGSPAAFFESIVRNSMLALALVLWKIPLIGWLLAGTVVAFEAIVLFGSKDGRRLGDELAKTYVIEAASEGAAKGE